MPEWLPKSIRNRDFAIQDPIFAILGGVLRSPIFDAFSIGKRSAENWILASEGRQKAEIMIGIRAVGT